jgi:signal peptidase I
VTLDAPPQARSQDSGFIKRVVAVGGDVVSCCSGGHLVVNGEVVTEPYAVPSQPRFARVRVPQDDVFVLGDNRMNSADSRTWGPIPGNLVIGRVVAHGAAADALSPIVLGGLAALVLTFVLWILWIRRTSLWRVEPGP